MKFDITIENQDRYVDVQLQAQSRNVTHFLTKAIGHTKIVVTLNSLKVKLSRSVFIYLLLAERIDRGSYPLKANIITNSVSGNN